MSGGVRAWVGRYPRVVDAAVAGVVFVCYLPGRDGLGPRWLTPVAGVLILIGLCAPHVLRRDFPFGAFAVSVLAFVTQLAFGWLPLLANVFQFCVLYNLAARRDRWTSLCGAGIAIACAQLAAARWDIGGGLLSGVVLIVSVWMWGAMIGTRRAYVAGLHERAVQLERERDDQARIAAAAERARIAREIHDIVAHSLSVVVVLTRGAALTVRSDPGRAEGTLKTVEDTTRSALTEMRRMLDVLRDSEPGSHAPQPGSAQLEQLVTEAKGAGLPVEFSMRGVRNQLPGGVDLTVYRVVQEALTNVRKHAGTAVTRVEVRVTFSDEGVEVRISDDGSGSSISATGGHGLIGMRERVTACGGTLRTGARREGGFEVVAILPLEGTA